jgi:GNAT superfamily N-acetyltransferase
MQSLANFRHATSADAPALARLQLRTAQYAYAHIFPCDAPKPRLEDLEHEWSVQIGSATCATFVSETDGLLVGASAAIQIPVNRLGRLSRLYVDPDHWRSGIGSRLHDSVLSYLLGVGVRTATLWVLEGNTHARNWYEARGWRPTGEVKCVYAPVNVCDVGYAYLLTERRGH